MSIRFRKYRLLPTSFRPNARWSLRRRRSPLAIKSCSSELIIRVSLLLGFKTNLPSLRSLDTIIDESVDRFEDDTEMMFILALMLTPLCL